MLRFADLGWSTRAPERPAFERTLPLLVQFLTLRRWLSPDDLKFSGENFHHFIVLREQYTRSLGHPEVGICCHPLIQDMKFVCSSPTTYRAVSKLGTC